jgi:hypothetical protein
MLTKPRIAVFVAIALCEASAAHAGGLPSIDTQKVCWATERALFGDSNATIDTCLGGEHAARDQLIRDWEKFSAADKLHCVLPAEYLPSYVEWLTCLEMEVYFRKIRKDGSEPSVSVRRGSKAHVS